MTHLARVFRFAWYILPGVLAALPLLAAPAAAQTGTEWDSLYDRIIRLEHRLNSVEQGGGYQTTTPSYSADPASSAALSLRIDQVEAELRNLLGQVQELNHQMRQVADQLRRFSEDAEYRFQQLEAAVREGNADPLQGGGNQQVAELQDGLTYFGDISVLEQYPQEGSGAVPLQPVPDTQAQGTQVLGTLPLSALEPVDMTPSAVPEAVETQPLDGSSVASTGTSATSSDGGAARALYDQSYNELLRRQFGDAEAGFQRFLRDHGSHELAPNAQYWLGETYYARGDFREAAAAFLTGYRTYESSAKAPDSLLKLGMSLRNLGERQQACATFAEVQQRFPNGPAAILDLAAREQSRAGC